MSVETSQAGIQPALRVRRTRMNISFATPTLDKLDELAGKWQCSRGVLVDKMTNILWQSVRSGRILCCHGQECRLNRTDVPEVF